MNLDGGIHEIPLPGVEGRLWLCGKHAIAPDPVGLLDSIGAGHVVCLVERFEIADRYPQYLAWIESSGNATWCPMPDLDFASFEVVSPVLEGLLKALADGDGIVVHCAAGRGRAGTLAVAVCQRFGMSLESAIDHVRRHRPGAGPEVGAQSDFVAWIATNAPSNENG